jgi:hypothetical protein
MKPTHEVLWNKRKLTGGRWLTIRTWCLDKDDAIKLARERAKTGDAVIIRDRNGAVIERLNID